MENQKIDGEQRPPSGPRRRWWALLVPLILTVAMLSVGGWRMWQVGQYQSALAEVNAQMAGGRNGLAAQNLVALLAWKPDSDEALYLLGVCEHARGRAREAFEAWARVPPDSPLWVQAIYRCRELRVERGRLDDAEQILKVAQKSASKERFRLNELFVPIYGFQGRVGEARRLIEEQWTDLDKNGEGASEKSVALLRLHIGLKGSIVDLKPTRNYLDQAFRLARDDDRVWLGKADLAIRDGSFDEATQLLDACLRKRPDDLPVWRGKLSLAVASNQLAMGREALEHLPADQATPAQIHELAAWIARLKGNLDTEERELEQLVQADPAQLPALTRLAELADKAGRPERGAELRRQKTEIEALQARYEELYQRNQPFRDAEEMARIAAKLANSFEAKAFLTIAVSENPGRNDLRAELLRLRRQPNADSPPGRTLAQAVEAELARSQNAN
jgi:enediyne biosynthesis protein E4